MMIRVLLSLFVVTSALQAKSPEEAVAAAHRELWSRFVDEHGLILDYVGLKGEIVRPTPEDCRDMKPSALSWGVPNEDGPMFNGLYLDAACNRWTITQKDEDRAKARRLIHGKRDPDAGWRRDRAWCYRVILCGVGYRPAAVPREESGPA